MRFLIILVSLGFFGELCSSQSAVPRLLGQVALPYAAFVEIFDDIKTNGSDRYTLYVSVFNPINFSKDPKYYLRSPGRFLGNISAWEFVEMNKTAFWPNNPVSKQ